ncbi:uncharacterized protein [Rutidosis leptorrhynchoides]|uniref:uncharacterized protein n=1 Tax=Rutidosis leptorrhynchoides TaxID=125765 RepID=UPI003A992711
MSTAYHPQTNGQAEVTNRALKRILEHTIGHHGNKWAEKLDDTLWAFRTAYKNLLCTTPYWMTYGKACHLPIELEYKALWTLKTCKLDPLETSRHRKMQMNELAELRDQAYETNYIYNEQTKILLDAKLIPSKFAPGDKALLLNSWCKRFSGKFKSRWSGPLTVIHVFPHGAMELEGPTGNFKVNGHRLKVYLEDHARKEDFVSLDPP